MGPDSELCSHKIQLHSEPFEHRLDRRLNMKSKINPNRNEFQLKTVYINSELCTIEVEKNQACETAYYFSRLLSSQY